MSKWPQRVGVTRDSLIVSARTAHRWSMLLARSLKLSEFYFAPISTIVILLSSPPSIR